MKGPFPASIYLLKVNNRNTRCGICPKLTIKTLFTLNMQLPTGFRIVTNDNLSDFKSHPPAAKSNYTKGTSKL